MKYKRIAVITVLCLIVVICASPVFAKVYARVSGSVKSEDGKPIAGCRVILIFALDGAKIETTTDEKGRWSKVNLRAGAWTMGFMADGYEPENVNVTLYAIKTNPPVDIKLAAIPESPLKKPDELYQQGKYADALQEYQRVLQENQELVEVWEKIGLCYYKLNDLENAVKAFKMMLEKKPGSREVLINLTAIYLGKGHLEEGMKYFNQLDEEALKDHSIFYNIGILLFNNNQMDLAIDYFKKSVSRNPNYVEAYFQLAMSYLNKGDMAEAKKCLQKIVEIAPESEKAAQARDIIKSLN